MPTAKKQMMIEESEMMFNESEISFVDDIELKRFKYEANSILDELRSCHMAKKRQIEHCFLKLLDNTSHQILDAPINQCIEDYLKSREFEEHNENGEIVDQSLSDENPTASNKKQVDSNMTNLEYEHEIELVLNSFVSLSKLKLV
jgi:hypothetical protein